MALVNGVTNQPMMPVINATKSNTVQTSIEFEINKFADGGQKILDRMLDNRT